MIQEKFQFLIVTLFFLFSVMTHCCLEMIVLKKQQPVFKSLYFENLELKREIIKKELQLQHYSAVIRGWNVAASTFFYSLYSAKTNDNVDKALMAKGEFYIKHYCAEQIEECSALGIITLADDMPFSEKKICIQKLSGYEFKPTLRDKELVLLEKCKRCGNEIGNKMILLRCAVQKDRKSFVYKLPCKMRKLIALFLFDLEESLF